MTVFKKKFVLLIMGVILKKKKNVVFVIRIKI